MAGVNVSREALTGVRMSLNQFKTEIADVPFSMERHAAMLKSECERDIRMVESQISELNQQISAKREELHQLEMELASARKHLSDTEAAQAKTEQALAGINMEIQSCISKLSQLHSTFNSGAGNEYNQYQQEVLAVESRLTMLKEHEWDAEMERQEQERTIQELNNDIKSLQVTIDITTSEILNLDRDLYRIEGKRDRLKMAYSNLQSELNNFTNSVRRFSQNALEQTQQDIAGVDQCIQYIDDYLATNL